MVIIGDQACQIDQELLKKLDVQTFDFPVFNNGENFDIDQKVSRPALETFRKMIADKKNVFTTSGIQPGEFKRIYDQLTEKDEIIQINQSYQNSSATVAILNEIKKDYSHLNIKYVDSCHLAGGYQIQLLEIARAAKEGKSYKEVCEIADANVKKSFHVGAIKDLYFLNRTGRIGKAKAVLGTLAKITPVLKGTDEQPWVIKPIGKGKNFKQINNRMVEEIKADLEAAGSNKVRVAINYSGFGGDDCDHLKELIESQGWDTGEISICYTSYPNMVHMGPEFCDMGYVIY